MPAGNRYYWKSNFVGSLKSGLGEVLRDGANAAPSPLSVILLFEVKGAIRRVPKEKMAFDHRDVNFEMSIIANWIDRAEDDANITWARNLWQTTQPFVLPSVYANHLTSDESSERVRAAYGNDKYTRLSQLKSKFDPTNLFRLNHNILPHNSILLD